MSELISVIVPAHNVEKYIGKCLASITRQTYQELEIIVIDDGSTDRTPEIIDDWASKDDRIVVIHNQSSSGHALVRNDGIDIAKGEYIGFTDSDDYIHPEFFERMHSLIKEHDADISLCMAQAFNEGEKEPEFIQKPSGRIHVEDHAGYISHFMDAFTGPIGWSWNKLFKAKLFKEIRYRDYLYEDLVMNAEFSNYVKKAVWTDDRMYAYRIRLGSITSAGTKNQSYGETQSFLATDQFFCDESPEFKNSYRAYILGKVANIYANARSNFGKEASKEAYDVYKKEYDSTGHAVIKPTNPKALKLFLARYLPGVYYRFATKY